MKKLSLKRLKNTSFGNLYEKLLLHKELSILEYKKLLSIAVIFIDEEDENIARLGYRIIVFYTNQTKDYKALYDVSLNLGIIPLVKSIEEITNNKRLKESFLGNFNSAFSENFKKNNIYLTEQQFDLFNFFEERKNDTISVIAPTSYGKSELIFSALKQNKEYNVLILVPTKALLAQTKKKILDSKIQSIGKIITHPEMYMGNEQNITAVLTQERLLRLLQKNGKLYFTEVFVDEAHNLLKNDDRNILLATAIAVLEKRNSNVVYKFLTPFLIDDSNLKIRYTKYENEPYHVNEYIKTERLYLYDFRNENRLKIYDQFLNEFYYLERKHYQNTSDFVIKESSEKNILYLNKPIDIEGFSFNLINSLTKVFSSRIDKACEDLSDFLHPEYFLISCIQKGVVYHHGAVPDNIRFYIEKLFSSLEDLRYVVTSSTLLEGMNLPVDKMFVLDNKKGNKKLSPSQFKNLVGRVSRFSEIFSDEEELLGLEPHIYLVISEYFSKNANVEKFLEDSMKEDKKIKDDPGNVLLENVSITEENKNEKVKADEFIENFEKGIVTNYEKPYAKTTVGEYCFLNNIREIDILENEQAIQYKINQRRIEKVDNVESVFKLFADLFLPFVDDNQKNLKRLRNKEAQRFYQMFLNWRIENTSFSEMISKFLDYWEKVEQEDESLVFVGRWGDEQRGGFEKLWTNIKLKSQKER